MRPPDDSRDEMFRSWLDQDAADRLLAGRVSPDDAPPGFQEVARLVGSLAAPPAAAELADERRAVAAAVRVLNDRTPSPANPRRWKMRSKLTRAKVAGLVVVGTLVGTSGMAAANVLPDPAQNVVSNALAHVGIDVPTSVEHPASTGEEISGIATTTDATGVAKGAEISTAASGGMSQAGQHGATVEGAAAGQGAAAATHGGTQTADEASGGADETGSSTADEASGGHSADGSGHAGSLPSVP
jgi:hypothetical protein